MMKKDITKKSIKVLNKCLNSFGIDEIDFENPEVISNLLIKWNVTIHTDEIENFKRFMQKPFAGRDMGYEYVEGHKYSKSLALDCMRFETESLVDAKLEAARDRRTKVILQKLDDYIKSRNNR